MASPEIWVQVALASMTEVARQAAALEADGFDGVMVFDSQSLIGDPYVCLALAASATTHLGLGIGVTNPVTRHVAVTANAMASLQAASSGRAVLGIGRGNSSLAYLGAAPVSLKRFEEALGQLQAYLRGEAVSVSRLIAADQSGLRALGADALGRAPEESRLTWLDRALPKVPVEVAATGPKAISLGVRLGDRVSFSVGADPERLSWAVGQARKAATDAGRAWGSLALTAYVSVVPLADRARARWLAGPDVAMHAQIAAMSANALADISADQRATIEKIAAVYDMTRHARHGAQTDVIDDAFLDANAVVGSGEACVEKLKVILACGFDRLVLMIPPPFRPDAKEAYRTLVEQVLPELRR